MINKNSIKIITLNERGEKIVIFGIFYLSDINKLISIAEEHNMPCLGFISQCEDTYFNEEQCKIIKEELKILQSHKELNKNLLDTLFAAANSSIIGYSYIKIEGCI
jgi:hypothetical protein